MNMVLVRLSVGDRDNSWYKFILNEICEHLLTRSTIILFHSLTCQRRLSLAEHKDNAKHIQCNSTTSLLL